MARVADPQPAGWGEERADDRRRKTAGTDERSELLIHAVKKTRVIQLIDRAAHQVA